jgi:death-on-curing protein
VEYLTVNEVLLLHARVIQRTGGSGGVRDMGLLESALARPRATFGGADLYPDLWTKAAALAHSLAQNHPFVDGNKRVALAAMGIFLELNGCWLTASNEDAAAFIQRLVTGGIGIEGMAAWLRAHSEDSTPRPSAEER